ncbi:type I pullulanase [Streptococcus zalophi]|uniref:pullulanase n=1 Tax=Streptococcus zalophi TaxID=640031 RepID=A0A934P9Q2_9STRE|nr:type I pullulanase [Streptococcus zalophi]MBJ8349585.1 type I pullulanase [Streptococcus zalophi]MCR8968065.1 type I pullulanase [Streptococcus zalophi]
MTNTDNIVIVHYHSKCGNYYDRNIWQWSENELGKEVNFLRFDSFGAVAHLNYQSPFFVSQAYLLFKSHGWSQKTPDYQINRHFGENKTEVWIVDGDDTVYYSRQAAVASHFYGRRSPRSFDMALNSSIFDKKWGFDGWLGFNYTKEETQFRLWAPTAEKVELILYDTSDNKASVSKVISMARGKAENQDNHKENTHGVWFLTVAGDLNFQAYRYRIYYRKRTFKETRDPYSIATTANGRRSVVVSKETRTPEHFTVKHQTEAFWRLDNQNKAVIYEMHIRDFSKSPTSGVRFENRGKFRGAFEEGTKNSYGDKTTFDYIKSLGITHIQLQPIFDHHQQFDSNGEYAYNWGYDPENYNVPEASFSSNPHNPVSRILELKELIQAYHDAGIAVIMDVVYNHTYSSKDSALQMAVPDYYYRMNTNGTFQNGSGCGNETASEKEMFRKYMVDSILYWVNEYNIDGFRFDLMGLHDIATMNHIRNRLNDIDPRIMMYGEGWDMGVGLLPEHKAKKQNAAQMPGIGFFNDDQRNAIKGAEVYGHIKKGFVSGEPTEDIVAKSILGSDELVQYIAPQQVLNYVEAHDNYNLNDLLLELHPEDDHETHIKRVELATAMNLLMQGMSFMQLGQEFLRTKLFPTGENNTLTWEDKERAMNSYNAPDTVNQVNWQNVTLYKPTVEFVKALIELKTKTNHFSYSSFKEIREHVFVEEANYQSGVISFIVKDEKDYKIVFNLSGNDLKIDMTKYNKYDIMISNSKRYQNPKNRVENLTATVFDITD